MAKAEPLGLAQLRDQLALLRFVRGDLVKAEACAKSSLEWVHENFPEDAPIAAMSQLRLGSILVGTCTFMLQQVPKTACQLTDFQSLKACLLSRSDFDV